MGDSSQLIITNNTRYWTIRCAITPSLYNYTV